MAARKNNNLIWSMKRIFSFIYIYTVAGEVGGGVALGAAAPINFDTT